VEIPLQGQYTQQDLRRAVSLSRGRGSKIGAIIIGIIAIFLLLSATVTAIEGSLEPMVYLGSMLVAFFLLALVVGSMWALPQFQARQLAKAPQCQGTVTGRATDEALEFHNALSESSVRWDAFVRYRMSPDVVLLYVGSAGVSIVPRSFLESDADWLCLRQHVQATVPKKSPWRLSIGCWLALVAVVFGLIYGLLIEVLGR
jgi:hypothetical protein